eukprot:2413861-Lingulodinium_polyedra.AAC.1
MVRSSARPRGTPPRGAGRGVPWLEQDGEPRCAPRAILRDAPVAVLGRAEAAVLVAPVQEGAARVHFGRPPGWGQGRPR